MRVEYGWIPGACGVVNLNGYNGAFGNELTKEDVLAEAGGGLAFASFIDNDICHQAYDEMCSKMKLIYQSPLTPNYLHGGREFFICIFDAKD